jgi:hypothetical protein
VKPPRPTKIGKKLFEIFWGNAPVPPKPTGFLYGCTAKSCGSQFHSCYTSTTKELAESDFKSILSLANQMANFTKRHHYFDSEPCEICGAMITKNGHGRTAHMRAHVRAKEAIEQSTYPLSFVWREPRGITCDKCGATTEVGNIKRADHWAINHKCPSRSLEITPEIQRGLGKPTCVLTEQPRERK